RGSRAVSVAAPWGAINVAADDALSVRANAAAIAGWSAAGESTFASIATGIAALNGAAVGSRPLVWAGGSCHFNATVIGGGIGRCDSNAAVAAEESIRPVGTPCSWAAPSPTFLESWSSPTIAPSRGAASLVVNNTEGFANSNCSRSFAMADTAGPDFDACDAG